MDCHTGLPGYESIPGLLQGLQIRSLDTANELTFSAFENVGRVIRETEKITDHGEKS
jgi:hypothetical protein